MEILRIISSIILILVAMVICRSVSPGASSGLTLVWIGLECVTVA